MNLAAILRAAEVAERRSGQAPPTPGYIEGLHPKQRAFVEDPARRKAALCSRRAGKSYGIAAWLLQGGETAPGALSVYVARSKGLARIILWPALRELDQKYGLGLWFREIDGQLMVQMRNGHRIWCAGAKDSSEIEKFRGPKYRRVAIDEAQMYGAWLRTLVHDIFAAALIDYAGEMLLAGTPSAVPAGLFYEATTGDGGKRWVTHSWTILDNPFIPNVPTELAAMREEYGWTEDHPTYQREWLGRWVLDAGALVYPYSANVNGFRELPTLEPGERWQYCIGMDLGYEDSTAWVVAAVRPRFPEIWLVHCEARQHLIPSAVAAHTERILRSYPGARVVADEGGFGKGYAEEMRQRHALPVEPADKTRKRAYQEMLAGDLRSGVVKLHLEACRDLADEMGILQWLPDRSAEDPRFENHKCDGMLYAYKHLRPYYRPEREPPREGSREYWRQVDEREKREARERAEQKNRRKWRNRKDWTKLVG